MKKICLKISDMCLYQARIKANLLDLPQAIPDELAHFSNTFSKQVSEHMRNYDTWKFNIST